MKTKARRVMELLNASPSLTDRQVAKEAGCHHTYVYILRKKMAHVPPCPEEKAAATNPLEVQFGGSHYKEMAIQPVTYIMGNNIPFAEGCVIKYVSRWRSKGGVEDLKKARHFLDMLISHEEER